MNDKQAEALKAELLKLRFPGLERKDGEYVECTVPATVFIRADSPTVVRVSAEDGRYICDYYGEFNNGYAYINKQLEQFAAARGLFWEWEDPGSIALYEA